MSVLLDRSFLAQIVIILAVCIGAWMTIVQPRQHELAALRQTIDQAENDPRKLADETLESLAARMSAIRQRVATIEAYNALAVDSSRLYGLISDLASAHEVNVLSLQPGSSQQAAPMSDLNLTRIDMAVEGTYENIAVFLESLNGLNAFVRPNSLDLSPTTVENRPLASARFACDILSFKLSNALTGAGGADGPR